MSSPRPACEDVVGVHGWRSGSDTDLDGRQPCSFCFPEIENVDAIDYDPENLVLTHHGDKIHRHKRTGDPDYQAIWNDRSTLRARILKGDLTAEDLGLEPLQEEA